MNCIYPIYCKFPSTNIIVKFTGLREGIVIFAEENNYTPLGHYCNIWLEHTDKRWIPLNKLEIVAIQELEKLNDNN